MDVPFNCPRCGNQYLPPPREGAYLCPVCRRLLPRRGDPGALTPPGRRTRGLALVLVAFFLTAAGILTVNNRPVTSAAAPRAEVEAEAVPTFAAVRVEGVRMERALRAFHRRELRRRPAESQPHAWAALDLLRSLLDRAQLAQPLGLTRPAAPVSEFARQRRTFELRQVRLEKHVARHYPREVRQAVRHAERSFLFAADPLDELRARQILGHAYRFAGRYDDAIRQFMWLATVEPFGDRGMLQRCFAHKRRPVALENRNASLYAYAGGRTSPMAMRSAWPYIRAHEKWLQRWPRSSFLRSRLGGFYYNLALQEALKTPDFPKPGPEFGRRVDACVYRHARASVEEGIRQFRLALALAEDSGDRAGALTELGHGYLTTARYDHAIPLLKEALDLEPWNRTAQDYLRQAYRRRGWGQNRIITAVRPPPGAFGDSYSMPSLNAGVSGYPVGLPRLSRDDAVAAWELIRRLRQDPRATATARSRRQAERNRLDELLPGSGTRYDSASGNVLALDLGHAVARLQRLERLGGVYPVAAGVSR